MVPGTNYITFNLKLSTIYAKNEQEFFKSSRCRSRSISSGPAPAQKIWAAPAPQEWYLYAIPVIPVILGYAYYPLDTKWCL